MKTQNKALVLGSTFAAATPAGNRVAIQPGMPLFLCSLAHYEWVELATPILRAPKLAHHSHMH